MDFTPIIKNVFSTFAYLVPLLIIIAVAKSAWFKGVLGEFIVNTAIKLLLDKQKYQLIKNVTLPTEGGSTQIDHIIVSEFGIFVIETKNMKGWIFGSEYQRQWTQKIYKHTSKFQNPLHQNYKHTQVLASLLNIGPNNLFSVIVFVGDSTFKTSMPENVTYAGGLISFIKAKTTPVLSRSEVDSVIRQINTGKLEPGNKTNKAHIEHVREIKHQKSSEKICPKCGNNMVLRTAKKGANAGSQFWGCSQFPRCKAAVRYSTNETSGVR